MMSEHCHDFVDHCNEETGIILRCMSRKLDIDDVYNHYGCMIAKHNNFVMKAMIDKQDCISNAKLVGIIYSNVVKNVVCPFTFILEALKWPEVWSIKAEVQEDMQIINRNDVMTGPMSYMVGLDTFARFDELKSKWRDWIVSMDIDPNVHSDDDKCYISENHPIDGSVHVQLYHLTPMKYAARMMSFRLTWLNDLIEC